MLPIIEHALSKHITKKSRVKLNKFAGIIHENKKLNLGKIQYFIRKLSRSMQTSNINSKGSISGN